MKFLMGFFPNDAKWICLQNLKFVALPVPETIEGTQKILAVPWYAHAHPLQLVSKISTLCDPDPPTAQTDRGTDRRTDDMQLQYRALHYSASRSKNKWQSHRYKWK